MSDQHKNRCRLARERAGLSVSQAAKLLDVERIVIDQIEDADVEDLYEDLITFVGRLADLYHVSFEWIIGEVEQHDYARVDAMTGAENLSSHDRDELAELAASMPRRRERA